MSLGVLPGPIRRCSPQHAAAFAGSRSIYLAANGEGGVLRVTPVDAENKPPG